MIVGVIHVFENIRSQKIHRVVLIFQIGTDELYIELPDEIHVANTK